MQSVPKTARPPSMRMLPFGQSRTHWPQAMQASVERSFSAFFFESTGQALASADGTPSIELAQTLVDMRRAGMSVVPCTGRNRAMIREDVRMLGLPGWIGEMGGILCLHEGTEADAPGPLLPETVAARIDERRGMEEET